MEDKPIILANIERYRALLRTELDDDRRRVIRKMLAEQEAELARCASTLNSSVGHLPSVKRAN